MLSVLLDPLFNAHTEHRLQAFTQRNLKQGVKGAELALTGVLHLGHLAYALIQSNLQ